MDPFNPKLLTLDEARRHRLGVTSPFVLTNGVFDLLHPGHVCYLREAALLGHVMVALNSDSSVRRLKGPGRPIADETARAFMLGQLRWVDRIVLLSAKRMTSLILDLKPDIYVKGGDYELATLFPSERRACAAVGAEIKLLRMVPGYSTSALVDRCREG